MLSGLNRHSTAVQHRGSVKRCTRRQAHPGPESGLPVQVANHDRDLAKSIHLDHTPTIYVVSNKTQGKPFVEVVDRSQLFQLIDAMKAE